MNPDKQLEIFDEYQSELDLATAKFEEQAVTDYEKLTDKLLDDVAKVITDIGGAIALAMLARRSSYTSLVAKIDLSVTDYAEAKQADIEELTKDAYTAGANVANDVLSEMTTRNYPKVNNADYKAYAKEYPNNLAANLAGVTVAAMSIAMLAALKKYGSGSWSADKAASYVSTNGLGRGLDTTLTTAWTDTRRAVRESARAQYAKSGIIKRYMRVSAFAKTTCAACIALHGTIYKVDEPLYDHPNGLCKLVAIQSGQAVSGFQTGEQWFSELSKDDQMAILGKGKYNLWQAGDFPMSQWVTWRDDPVYGRTPTPTTLKDAMK